ncbi:hypothetical protein WR25_04446 [Diploscapter pachys]|uniref:Protein kinase domain-containing protein n=1 Tax=Diploscapter pachys TaxID=2018661 RepID=A0A2A2LGG5_9BILA|nr:hypothetical protein WR25_04446 [Diploscapter pachys]
MAILHGDIPLFNISNRLNMKLYARKKIKKTDITYVAIKRLLPYAAERDMNDFQKEIDILKVIEYHPNVVCMYGYAVDKFSPQIILEYCENGDLRSYISNLNSNDVEVPIFICR